ncbi:tRNA(Ile)-lysidine synthetase [Caenispirillum salinarum AK4]|uniref:tRNA(Ile)-lysidine synthase n=1 Tax=Caenispirillum salinarum AK4 TaxID=1238182 RepID=K9HLY2_9PROT|nr:tRNA lysidine(34) synthetase TilS [Caenispirillum salinarum]EKV31363.1 tRNA(Ile)-lysidine synthetase [Caenispirillum salinarum AK4]
MGGPENLDHRAVPEDGTARPVSAEDFAARMAPLGPFERPPRLAVAVSGGADSLALALLAHEWAAHRGGSVLALTVDHGLRPEAAEEARAVGRRLAARGIDHAILTNEGPAPHANVQAEARGLRYRLLLERCRGEGILHLLTAHHREDQAETLLLRLGRGSGLRGLSAMAPVAEMAEARVLRPLLDVPRASLSATCAGAGVKWVDDPSNRDRRHARVRARALLPALETAEIGLTATRLAQTAARLGRARAAEDEAVAALLAEAATVHPLGHATLDPDPFADAPEEIALRALSRVLACIGGSAHTPRLDGLEQAFARLGTAELTVAGCRVVHRQKRWIVCREAGRAAPPAPLPAGRWDGRWCWVPGSDRPDIHVGALGEAGLPAVPKEVRRALPSVVVQALPAVWKDGGVIGLPGLGWWRDMASAPPLQPGSLRFAPRVAMTYVGCGGLRRGRRHLCRQVDISRVAEGRMKAGTGHRPRRAT